MPNLEQMVARQRVLAEFGDFALRSESLNDVLQEACRLVGEALDTDFAKILEIEENEESLLVKAGIGWRLGIVGERRLPMSKRSSETYSIEMSCPVATQDISKETRFEFADFLQEHGVAAMVNVPILLPGGKPYGLLQVDHREPREFDVEDVEFLQTYSTILGPVIDRLHKTHSLKDALEKNRRLLEELQHRVKNHLAIIASFVSMRGRQVESEDAREELRGIGGRIESLRLLHEHLYVAGTTERLRLRPFIMQLVENLCKVHEQQAGNVRLKFSIDEADLSPDMAVPLGLIFNEFTVNSLKHAFDGEGGVIAVAVERCGDDRLLVHLGDDGKGLPLKPQSAKPGSGTGMKLIEALARQIGAEPVWSAADPGTQLLLEVKYAPP